MASATGYKKARIKDNECVVTLEIPESAKTNMARGDVVDARYAKFRCSHAVVRSIRNLTTGNAETVAITIFKGKKTEYRVGETIHVEDYDEDINAVCTRGIHFFLTEEIAEFYDRRIHPDGIHKTWHENGRLKFCGEYANGKLRVSTHWRRDGSLLLKKLLLQNGNILRETWHDNGVKACEMIYRIRNATTPSAAKRHFPAIMIDGVRRTWFKNGKPQTQIEYVQGRNDGLRLSWHENGKPKVSAMYKNNVRHGKIQEWAEDGSLLTNGEYKNGKRVGLFEMWTKDKKKYYSKVFPDVALEA
jgi:antitoxin component YwqK of YwqJK toxin-antitoxin module